MAIQPAQAAQDELTKRAARFLPLSEASYLILVALAGPRHGYGVMQTVSVASGGQVRLGPGTLYGALTKLLDHGLIRRAGDAGHGEERRKLYSLTALGRCLVDLESERLERLARWGRGLLRGEPVRCDEDGQR
jgi:DNA-binding PadR family transcriptional regulator